MAYEILTPKELEEALWQKEEELERSKGIPAYYKNLAAETTGELRKHFEHCEKATVVKLRQAKSIFIGTLDYILDLEIQSRNHAA